MRTKGLEPVNENGLTEKEFLEHYDPDKYKKPSIAVDILLFTVVDEKEKNYRKLPQKRLQVLLIKRKNHPFIGQWALPGGFMNIEEGLATVAKRELKEETNISDIYMEQLYTWGEEDENESYRRDPRMRVVSVSYMALVDSSKLDIRAGDDAEDAKWFTISKELIREDKNKTENGYKMFKSYRYYFTSNDGDKITTVLNEETLVENAIFKTYVSIDKSESKAEKMAFDHAKIINYGIERLANKLEYTPIAFNLMPELFTLTELQNVYETILDKPLAKAQFRKKIRPMVTETDKFKEGGGHNKARLYLYNPYWKF